MRSHVISTRPTHRIYLVLVFVLAFLLLLTACSGQSSTGSGAAPKPTATLAITHDAYGTPITFPSKAPQRIVSLVPTTSEILGALHLDSRVVAVDYYTDYPADLTKLPKVSNADGQYNVEQIVAEHPDLVLSYGESTRQYDAQLANLGLHVVDLPIANFDQILQEILTVGRLTLTQSTATTLVNQLQQQIKQIEAKVAGTTAPKVMIELDDSTPGKPYVFGGGSYGDQLLQDANGINIFHNDTGGAGYPQVTDEAIISDNPQFIILTEPAQYGGDPSAVYKRPNWGNIAALKLRQVYRVNTDLIGRPGPRLVEGLQCVAQLIHPDKYSGIPLPAYCTA
ncbi:MAG TPA: ABC transporter substrate-binding protein [Ktedonobacteraceae bacterium]|nr:ABC transporter substrate-binding protein [Ktedonobacteraceae bacterium]